ncbi:MAG: TauD/TfdA family dioxygenase [Pseudomonadota bacterium]
MNITPLATAFGAEISGVRLEQAGPDLAARLQGALLEHGLLVVRCQDLTPAQHVAASRLFGELETFPAASGQLDRLPQVFRLASRAGEGHVDVGRYWHSDGSFRPYPTPISIWHTIITPAQGGDTLFTDLRQAHADLPAETRRRIAGLATFHRNGVRHPLVLPHPVTGDASLYLNVGLTAGIAGMPSAEYSALLHALDQHLSRAGAVYRHVWRPGDVVVADNLRVAHRATPISPDTRRVLDRTTVVAGTAYTRLACAAAGTTEAATARVAIHLL